MKKISIIVPVYNTIKYIEECVSSLLEQTLDNIEIILVDDGSFDGSEIKCDEYAREYDNIYVVHQKNSGQSKARNIGITHASGKYIMFVDSDDSIVIDACEKLYYLAEKHDADIVWGEINNKNIMRRKGEEKLVSLNKLVNGQDYLIDMLKNKCYDIVPWLKMLKRDFIINNNLWFVEGCFFEDQESTLRLLLVPKSKLFRTNFNFYNYRIGRIGSTTNVYEKKKGLDQITIINKMIKLLKATNLDRDVFEAGANIIAISIYHLSCLYPKMKELDRKEVYGLLNRRQLIFSKYNQYLSLRMRIQLFIFSKNPDILSLIYKIKGV